VPDVDCPDQADHRFHERQRRPPPRQPDRDYRRQALEAEARARRVAKRMPAKRRRLQERMNAERVNGRLKDEFGGRRIHVRGHLK